MGKITYVINDSSSETIQDNVQEYFIDSQNVELQPPEEKSGYEFDGCYFDKSCEDKYKVGKLGKDNYLGDVTKKPETITVKKTDSINNSTSVTFTTSAKVKFTFNLTLEPSGSSGTIKFGDYQQTKAESSVLNTSSTGVTINGRKC